MKITIAIFCCLLAGTALSQSNNAQNKKTLDSLDKIVIAEIITPAEAAAKDNGQDPNWADLTKKITDKYSAVQADRVVTKAQIYLYYGRNWPLFSTAIVHYTEKFEDKDDLKLMNTNAKFILQRSNSAEELRIASGWIKHAVDKEPANTAYQETYNAIQEKLKTL